MRLKACLLWMIAVTKRNTKAKAEAKEKKRERMLNILICKDNTGKTMRVKRSSFKT